MVAPASPDLVIRRSTPDDAPAFARIMGDDEVYPGLLQLPYADAAAWRARLAEQGGSGKPDLSIVGVLDGEVVATAGLFTLAPVVRRRHALSLGLSVDPAVQGRGVGSRMMVALTAFADDWAGILRIELTVWSDNARAIRLYERHGFVREGLHRGYALRAGRYVDAVAMARLHPNPPRWD